MSPLRRAARAVLPDAALAAALGFRVWQGAAGIVTILLVGHFFSLDLQGCYYTFLSVLAFQTLSDLGLFIVIINVSSHEWAGLQLQADHSIAGDPAALSRLVSLGRQVGGWYGSAALISGAMVAAGGLWFFGRTIPLHVEWRQPWMILVALSTLSFCASPFVALLEGCNQVATVNRYRLGGAVVGSLAGWIAIACGLGLWALPLTVAAQVGRDVLLLGHRYNRFFRPFLAEPSGARVAWKEEIWPMQWRLGLQGLSQYVSTQLFNPVLMYYHGPAAAGRFGMTWVAVNGIQTVALAWIQARVPSFGMLAAQRDQRSLDRLWLRSSAWAVGAVVAGGLGLGLAIAVLEATRHPFASRLLPSELTLLLVFGVCCAQAIQGLAAYLRAYKVERLTPVGVGSSVLAGSLAWLLGRTGGLTGVVAAYAIAMAGVLPLAILIWWERRRALGTAAAHGVDPA